jgi:hypothetical protein
VGRTRTTGLGRANEAEIAIRDLARYYGLPARALEGLGLNEQEAMLSC